jgi:hypothetical protein
MSVIHYCNIKFILKNIYNTEVFKTLLVLTFVGMEQPNSQAAKCPLRFRASSVFVVVEC